MAVPPHVNPHEWSNHPHTLTLGLLTLVYFIHAAFRPSSSRENTNDDETLSRESLMMLDIRRGLKYACLFFLVYCVTQLRDGHFIRPHPILWRIVTGLFILYEMLLIVLLFCEAPEWHEVGLGERVGPTPSPHNAPARLLAWIDPTLGHELPSRSYGEDCRLYTPEHPVSNFHNVKSTVLDAFVPMHFFGWFIGALMIRNRGLCWLISVLFEVYELTFQHWLPNFRECWWDHVFLDILLMNALGIELGMFVSRHLEMKEFNWVGIATIPDLAGKAQRALLQFTTPFSWLPYHWKMFQSPKRFVQVCFMILVFSVMMLNSFFLKHVLWVPSTNPLNVYRLLIWYSAGAYAIAEYYIFCSRNDRRKLGPRAWLGLAVVLTEVMIIVKFRRNYFTAPFPLVILRVWSVFGLVLVVGPTLYFGWILPQRNRSSSSNQS